MIDQYVESGSSFSGDIDNLILVVGAIVGFWFFLALGAFFFLIIKFSAKEGVKAQYISGELKHEKRWITIPHNITLIFDIMIVVMAIKVWTNVKITMPQADQTVRVIAQQWAWTFVHPGPDGKLDTPDDITTIDELHVQKDKTYHFELQSRDVLHSFSVPVFRLKQDCIPGRTIKGWFKPTITGTFDIQCTEICGIGHAIMPARIVIDNADEHQNWVKQNAPEIAAIEGAAPTSLGGTP
jgi:cytochrome c oxidase subunit II